MLSKIYGSARQKLKVYHRLEVVIETIEIVEIVEILEKLFLKMQILN